jgi:hypothetical protein
MNMPSSQGFSIHQIIFDHKSKTVAELCATLNDEVFVVGRQIYKRYNADGESVFLDRGDIIVNTAHIGKVQEYYDNVDEEKPAQTDRQRPPLRNRNQY